MDIMHKVLVLVDFVGFYTVLSGQSEDAILSWSNVSATQIDPLCLLILKKKEKQKTLNLQYNTIL